MRTRVSSASMAVIGASWIALSSCSSASNDIEMPPMAVGGTPTMSTGGAKFGSGGSTLTGGTKATGGATVVGTTGGTAPGNGGSNATGGVVTVTGGKAGVGGAAVGGNASGSTSNSGGANPSGGNNTNGGTASNGGAVSNGGTVNTGGALTNGGTVGNGGNSGSCTDTPRSSESCADAVKWGFCGQAWFAGSCQASCGACSGGNGGTTATGGTSSTGGAATGGRATGGAATGGVATGGVATGGVATGGVATGGVATGGVATGGVATGGVATGGAATGGAATGGSTGGASVPPLTNGSQGITTRYWDCCMPSCAWKTNANADGKSSPATVCAKNGSTVVAESAKSACSGGTGYQCNWGAPWQAGPNLSYGYAAHNGGNCGKCYQLDFTGAGDNAGAQSLKGKTIIVQTVNTGGIAANQFDLLIPGGGVGANNACTGSNGQWGNVNGGQTYGGFLATCGTSMSCVTDMCQAAFGSNSSLMAACSWFIGWFAGANNPKVLYAEVPCPADLTNRSGLK